MPESGAAPTITVDRELCMGSGMCIVYAPGTFAHDDETKAVVVDPAGDPIESIRNAVCAIGCPDGVPGASSHPAESTRTTSAAVRTCLIVNLPDRSVS